MRLERAVQRLWSRCGPPARALWPLSALYCAIARHRRRRFLAHPPEPLPVPGIVVGNISIGGTGKTPAVIALCAWLRRQGWRPGVISRGYGGRGLAAPQRVTAHSRPAEVGDEPVLIARRTGVPVVVSPDRRAAARYLLAQADCDILLADDGLQHYRLARDIEIAMIDGRRRLGNGYCLPAGPLREPPQRLRTVDFILVTDGPPQAGKYPLRLRLGDAWSLRDPACRRPLSAFAGAPVHAVAGIGHPERFFVALEAGGLGIVRHPFPDHHRFRPADLDFAGAKTVLMTEKDAVKCEGLAAADAWAVPADAELPPAFTAALAQRLRNMRHGQETAGNTGMPGDQGPADL